MKNGSLLFWSVAFLVPFSYIYGWQEGLNRFLEAVLLDFVPFIILLFGLFATAGGIMVDGRLAGTPKTNVLILLVGTLMASWIGTTGAAMLLIRPLIRINAWRRHCFAHHGFPDFPRGEYGRVSYAAR